MSRTSKKSCLIIFILFLFFILLAIALSQWQTNRPKLNLSSFSSSELFKAGQQKVKEGDYKEARVFVEAALDKEAGNVTYLGELAVIKYKLEDYNGAIAEYQKILKTGKNDGFAYNGMANIYRDISEKSEVRSQKSEYRNQAIKTYKEGIAKDPKYIALYSNYAIMLISADKKTEAKKIIEDGITATGAPELKELLKTIQQ